MQLNKSQREPFWTVVRSTVVRYTMREVWRVQYQARPCFSNGGGEKLGGKLAEDFADS